MVIYFMKMVQKGDNCDCYLEYYITASRLPCSMRRKEGLLSTSNGAGVLLW